MMKRTLAVGFLGLAGLIFCFSPARAAEANDVTTRKEKAIEKIDAVKDACGADEQKFCADVKPGEGRKIACLKQHQSELSSTCQQQLSQMPHRRMEKTPPPPIDDATAVNPPAAGEGTSQQ